MTIKTIIYSSCSAVPFKMFARLLQASQPAGEIFSVWCCWWWSVRRLRCLHQHYCELAGATPGTPGGRSLLPPWPNTPCSSSSSQTSPWSPPPPWGLLCWHNVKQSYCLTLSYCVTFGPQSGQFCSQQPPLEHWNFTVRSVSPKSHWFTFPRIYFSCTPFLSVSAALGMTTRHRRRKLKRKFYFQFIFYI